MSVTYIDAIHDAQKDLLAEDKDVFLYGQDIGVFGGAFKATKGLKELFPDRVIDAPISEDAMAGMVTGAAVMGKKPIMEVQFADFSTIAFNQIVNMAATHYYRTGIPANITVRLPCGGTPGTGPFHSQSLEALFAHYPGLHVMTPATVADAYWMLRQAVEVPDPVIFLEHKFLYRWLKAEDNYREAPVIPFGMARIARTGKHATVVAYSAMVPEAVRAADLLAKESGGPPHGAPAGHGHRHRLRSAHWPRPGRRGRLPVGGRHVGSRFPHRGGRLPSAGRSAPAAQRQGHPHPPASQPVEGAPPYAGIHRRLHPPSFIHLIQPSFHHA